MKLNRPIKRPIALLLIFSLLVTVIAVHADTDTTSSPSLGDVTQDGVINAEDALLILQGATQKIQLTEAEEALADVDADQTVTSNDALLVLQYATKKITSFPGEHLSSTHSSSTSSTTSSTASTATTTTSTVVDPPPYDPGYQPLNSQKIEAESGSYPDTCKLVNYDGGTAVGFTSTGDVYSYPLSVDQPGYYLVGYHLSVITSLSITFSVDGADIFTQQPHTTGDWNTYYTNYSDQLLYLSAGQHTLQFEQSQNGMNFDWFSLTFVAEYTTDQLTDGRTIAAAFEQTAFAAGKPLPLSVTGLQEGDQLLSYLWFLNGRPLLTERVYAPGDISVMELGEVQVWPIIQIGTATYCTYASGSFVPEEAITLPVITINTENSAPITSKEDYLSADMSIAAQDMPDEQLYTGKIEIRGRGNATWAMYPKKPYKIKLDKKADLFGMGSNKHWVLLANYRDRTFMRNRLAFDLSEQLGLPTTQSVFVRLILNGQDVGVYELCEQIRVGKTRVDIMDWEDEAEDETDLSPLTSEAGYDTTGGFLIELNGYYDEVSKFKTAHDVPITVKSPEYLNTNDEMFTYLTTYIQDFENAVYADTFVNDKGQHYSDLFDVDSLVNYWLVNEFMGNLDSGTWSSTYMYKDIGGDKFHMGPVWDFDSSSGNYLDHGKQCPANKWIAGHQGLWYQQLYRDRTFVEKLQARYWENREFFGSMVTRAETYYNALYAEANTDHAYWQIPTTYAYDGQLLVTWLKDRLAFFDEQFATVDTAYASLNG